MNINPLAQSNIIRRFVRTFPGLFSKEAVTALVGNNSVSLEAASDIATIMATAEDGVIINPLDAAGAKVRSVQDFKLASALEISKLDDRNLYDEFLKVDEQRSKIVSTIASRYGDDVHTVLGIIKGSPGVKPKEIDDILSTPIFAEKANIPATHK